MQRTVVDAIKIVKRIDLWGLGDFLPENWRPVWPLREAPDWGVTNLIPDYRLMSIVKRL
ncbi:MAG: hypothetical protein AAF821_08035 [Cyanobacteria bacterium P01_D01_bin.156]